METRAYSREIKNLLEGFGINEFTKWKVEEITSEFYSKILNPSLSNAKTLTDILCWFAKLAKGIVKIGDEERIPRERLLSDILSITGLDISFRDYLLLGGPRGKILDMPRMLYTLCVEPVVEEAINNTLIYLGLYIVTFVLAKFKRGEEIIKLNLYRLESVALNPLHAPLQEIRSRLEEIKAIEIFGDEQQSLERLIERLEKVIRLYGLVRDILRDYMETGEIFDEDRGLLIHLANYGLYEYISKHSKNRKI